jgi:hypothetical protein
METTASATPDGAPPHSRPRMSKVMKIGLGLLFTLVGLFLMLRLVPTAPSSGFLASVGAGLLLLWVGGILMGVGSRS